VNREGENQTWVALGSESARAGMDNWGHCIWVSKYPTSKTKNITYQQMLYIYTSKPPLKSSSRAVITERTILSPFTKEYRVPAANSGTL